MDIKELSSRLRGKFIVFDGPDGAGKSTQCTLLEQALTTAGGNVVRCRDPGGTEIGERIRSVILGHDLHKMHVNCETLLFMASRGQLVAEVIRPSLEAGRTVLCDRFVSATCAYQGAAGYDPRQVIELARFAIGTCWPDVTILMDVETEKGFTRIAGRLRSTAENKPTTQGASPETTGDAMEARAIDYHRQVRRIFHDLHEYYPTPVITVDCGADVETVHRRVLEALTSFVG